ncbi:HAMP domain-containing protein [Hypnocyclicus thermotrophus]|uniref:histidine kinase n=1 Tax=Hypnocyclicus thermotrophus TaxID=1627895 RepID=A0AA46I6L4_9FUSO|nr:HAMP domain-containing sensor histidine kinase [Hypnocyclicus thermotrophus]TDT72565.1 HAMP domain-containing protein [Hypnocyclicus thermotrophus]
MKLNKKIGLIVSSVMFIVFIILFFVARHIAIPTYITYKKAQIKEVRKLIEKGENVKLLQEKYLVGIIQVNLKEKKTNELKEQLKKRINEKFKNIRERPPIPPEIEQAFLEFQHSNKINEKFYLKEIRTKQLNANILLYKYVKKNGEAIFISAILTRLDEIFGIITLFSLIMFIVIYLVVIIVINILVSKKLINPIIKIKNITYKMAELDFKEKIDINSKDELEELAKSINFLSEELELNINKLKADIKKKEKINEIQKRFYSNMSHELKTPLAIIQGYSKGLKDNIKPQKRDFYYEVIQEEIEKMVSIINNLININKIDIEEINKEKIEIKEFIINVLEKYNLDIEEKNVKLDLKLIDKSVLADKKGIKSVVDNILSNAFVYVKENGKIKINVEEFGENTIKISIFNEGKNIPEESLDYIWRPFYRADDLEERKYGGTGLGLAITSGILKNHNSDFGVINKKNGVEFYFTLEKAIKDN